MAILNHLNGKEECSCSFVLWRCYQGSEGHLFSKSGIIRFLGNIRNLGISYLSVLNERILETCV